MLLSIADRHCDAASTINFIMPAREEQFLDLSQVLKNTVHKFASSQVAGSVPAKNSLSVAESLSGCKFNKLRQTKLWPLLR